MVKDGAFSHNMTLFKCLGDLNLEGPQNCLIGSKVMAILVKRDILPSGRVAFGRVCACSLRSRLVFKSNLLEMISFNVAL